MHSTRVLAAFLCICGLASSQNFLTRLSNGNGFSSGRIEVSLNGTTWGTVCGSYTFSENEGDVVCHGLGYKWSTVHLYSYFGTAEGPIFLAQVECDGTEKNLTQCKHDKWEFHTCTHYLDVGVTCHNHTVRTISSGGHGVGTVELRLDNIWRQICDTNWNSKSANVACRSMGYSSGIAKGGSFLGSSYFTQEGVSLANVTCQGDEEHLMNCSMVRQNMACPYLGQASVICYSGPVDNTFRIQLVNSTDVYWGRVLVKRLGVWGRICSYTFNNATANVICRQQGFKGGVAFNGGVKGSLPVWTAQTLVCKGNETSLENCQVTWGRPVYSCYYTNYVLCYNEDLNLKLAGGDKLRGRVEIVRDGQLGTICDTNWDDYDAMMVCRQLGFGSGSAVTGSYFGHSTGAETFLDNVQCAAYIYITPSVYSCQNSGWKNNSNCGDDHVAGVRCYQDVRLYYGTDSAGILQVTTGNNFYYSVCNVGFDDIDATVACKEFGFKYGKALPESSFGTFYSYNNVRSNLSCVGDESSILDCMYQSTTCLGNLYSSYASVECFDIPQEQGTLVHLDNVTDPYVGAAVFRINGTWGHACRSFWDDAAANVTCKMLNYAGGISFLGPKSKPFPIVLFEVKCRGNETNISQCPRGTSICQEYIYPYYGAPGVMCYDKIKPRLQLSQPSMDSGRIDLYINGEVGTICNNSWTRYGASAACRQMGYNGGMVYSNFSAGSGTVFLSNVYCDGSEQSLLQCRNSGWKSSLIPSYCRHHQTDAGAICFRNIQLMYGKRTEITFYGKVDVYVNGTFMTVDGTNFTDKDSRVVCNELGYGYSQTMLAGAFGTHYDFSRTSRCITKLNCTGSESNILDCKHVFRSCASQYSFMDYAVVACSKNPITNGVRVYIGDIFPSLVTVERYGVNGSICLAEWDDKDADVICREKGYMSGIAFSTYNYDRNPIVLSPKCTGTESMLSQCPGTTGTTTCTVGYNAPQAVCFTGSGITLSLSRVSQGRVDVSYNGEIGTICDYYWTDWDASVVCKQMGYLDGVTYPLSQSEQGSGRVWFYGPSCTGTEESIWSCLYVQFNYTVGSCSNHQRDVGVRCTGTVRLDPNNTYGAVQVYDTTTSGYSLVCSDEFDDNDATVVCRSLGFIYGYHICCSAFGYLPYGIGITNVRCSGTEETIDDCQTDVSLTQCPSLTYASVACSMTRPTRGFQLKLASNNYGAVQVNYFNHWGYMCTDGFDDSDASVVCREINPAYSGGVAYAKRDYFISTKMEIRWLTNLNCTGDEAYLSRCGSLSFGNIANCTASQVAGAYCYSDTGLQIRLANGSSNYGRVEISFDNSWGTICSFDNFAANVLCRQLNFTSGVSMTYGYYGSGSGPVYFRPYCTGKESSIMQCRLLWTTTDACPHIYDGGVRCFGNVRVTGGLTPDYGRVEMLSGSNWMPFCDTNFDDKDAKVVCKEMGYLYGKAQCCSVIGSIDANSTMVTDVQCSGGESSVEACASETGSCGSGSTASVYCRNTAITENTLQSQIGSGVGSPYYGYVMANIYGFWGPICNYNWDDSDADVLCREKGFTGGYAMSANSYSRFPSAVGNFSCTGNEVALSSCPYGNFTSGTGCNAADKTLQTNAGVLCYQHSSGVAFRVKGGAAPGRGRVEIRYEDTWSTVCGDFYWSDMAAKVICKQIGYKDGISGPSVYTSPPKRTHMSYINCAGTENSILQCPMYWYSNPIVSCYYPSQVICYKEVRLDRGDTISNGVVQIYKNGIWGTVCSSGWGQKESDVTCKQLGFESGLPMYGNPYGYVYVDGTVTKVTCIGSESSLLDCGSTAPTFSCGRTDYAAVFCYNGTLNTTYTSMNLSGGSNNTGEVMLTFMNITGHVCADGWDNRDATVVCRELGFTKGESYYHFNSDYSVYYQTGPYWTSNVKCDGTESRLEDCPHDALGKVKTCGAGHFAGVLCYTNNTIYYDLAGGGDSYGRVEMIMDGVRGSICASYWDNYDAQVICRYFGYVTGEALYQQTFPGAVGPVYDPGFRCTSEEDSLGQCPHNGWHVATSPGCQNHAMDASVFCYTSVKLATDDPVLYNHGAVHIFSNNSWHRLCDTGFDDNSARAVCRELGFVDGRAICCSAYGPMYSYEDIAVNVTISCDNDDQPLSSCIKHGQCDSDLYASVVCSGSTGFESEDMKIYLQDETRSYGQVVVDQYNVSGRVCDTFWDNADAKRFCLDRGHNDGAAYHYSDNQAWWRDRGRIPYFVSSVNCSGTEAKFSDCDYNTRLDLGNCSTATAAGVICFNDSGIEYRLARNSSMPVNEGRVEIGIDGLWGTVCDYFWDDLDATVFCRQLGLGYQGGYSVYSGHNGYQGNGTVWMSYLECKGTESNLHECPHQGSIDSVISDYPDIYTPVCSSHIHDAGVSCYGSVRIHLGRDANTGAVEVYKNGEWYYVCDDSFDFGDARVVCKSVGYKHGAQLLHSAFGNITTPDRIKFSEVNCRGTESMFSDCPMAFDKGCSTGTYASVFCSYDDIEDNGFKVRLNYDTEGLEYHGLVEVNINGIWGTVCMDKWDDVDANVTCKQLGFAGGLSYQHYYFDRNVILLSNVTCKGTENSLENCSKAFSPGSCGYYSRRAGVICYQQGIELRLGGSDDPSKGLVQIKYDGQWGAICLLSWDRNDTAVVCRQMGYKDGLPISSSGLVPLDGISWVSFFWCMKEDKTLLSCDNYGFNNTYSYQYYCTTAQQAAVQCYDKLVEVTDVRLVGGNSSAGRVEVYVSGPDQWGTICNMAYYDFTEKDAGVICRQLGFATGKPSQLFGKGTGPIWFYYPWCLGTENNIESCYPYWSPSYCSHMYDVGVICSGTLPTDTTSTSTSTTKISTPPSTKPATTSTASSTTTTKSTTGSTTSKPSRGSTSTIPTIPSTKPTTTSMSSRGSTRGATTTKSSPRSTTRSTSVGTTKSSIVKSTTASSTTVKKTTQGGTNPPTTPFNTIIPETSKGDASLTVGLAAGIPATIVVIVVLALGLYYVFRVRRSRQFDVTKLIALDSDASSSECVDSSFANEESQVATSFGNPTYEKL